MKPTPRLGCLVIIAVNVLFWGPIVWVLTRG